MPRPRSTPRPSHGGARAAGGLEFQAQVFAWFAARAIAGTSPGLGLDDDIRITAVGSESNLPLDDVGVALDNGGFVLVQAKAGMRKLSPDSSDLCKAIDQVVAAVIGGIRTVTGMRKVEAERDRLLVATNQYGSQAFDDLSKVCRAFPGPPKQLPLEEAVSTKAQRRALSTLLDIVRQSWREAAGCDPSEADLRRLLDVLQVQRFDFQEGDGVDLLRTTELLRSRAAGPLVDGPFTALVGVGRSTIQGWRDTRQLRHAVRKSNGTPVKPEAIAWLRELPQPYVERDGLSARALGVVEARAVTVIAGAAGCGKTTLAVRLAHDLAHRFPDGQLMIDMRGFSSEAPMSTAEAVDLLLHQMGAWASNEDQPPDLRRLRLIGALERGRFIVLLDNVADSRSVLPLLPRGDESKTIITTRRLLATLSRERGAGHVEVGLLTATEAAKLLTTLVGHERVDAEPIAARRLLAACANLPLAVSIAGSQVAQLSGQSLGQIAAGLTAAEERLDFLDLGEPESSIRSVLSWSYTSLTEEQRRTYLLLGTAPSPDLDVAAAGALLDTSQARGLLRGLRRLALAEENSDGGFAMHDVLRDFASSLVGAGHLPQETIRDAHGRLLHHYVQILRYAKSRESLLESNIDRVLTTARHCAKGPHRETVRAIADELIDPLWHRGRFGDAISLLRSVIDGFEDSTAPAVHAYFLRLLAITLRHAGEPGESGILARAALRILDENPSASSARAGADCHYLIGIAEAAQEDHASALDHFHQALAQFLTSGGESDLGDVLNAIGWSLSMTGEHERALERCLQATAVHERVGPPRSLAADLDSIGYIYRSRGEHRSAMDYFKRCLAIYREIGHRPHEARTLEEMGDTAEISSDPSTASLYWTQAAALLREIGLDAARIHAKLKGRDK